MKNLIQLIILLLVIVKLHSQEKSIITEFVTLENLFTFVIDHFDDNDDPQNITFLLKTHQSNFSEEDKFILKQTFKLLSNRLTENDYISIATYNAYSGIALKKVKPDNLKQILHVIEYPKANIKAFAKDGIDLAYQYMNENYEDSYKNKLIIVRLPERQLNNANVTHLEPIVTKQKGNGAAVVLSALALLPEIISVIKN